MRWKRVLLWSALALLALFVVAIIVGQLSAAKSTTFRVTVPESTPEEDTIVLHIEGERFAMRSLGNRTYEHTFDTSSLEFNEPRRHGYSRGGFPAFGEDTFLGNVGGRTFNARKEPLVEDTVVEWKWLPNTPAPDPDIGSLAATKPIAPRRDFWVGPNVVDFWNADFRFSFNSTASHAKEVGYSWVEIDPPWDYRSTDPPVIDDEGVQVPAWPEAELRNEIRQFKAAGLKVFLAPQICCAPLSFEGRSDAWWGQWFDQFEGFVAFHADLAREEGVDAIAFGGPEPTYPGHETAPPFAAERWDAVWAAARGCECPLGLTVYTSPQEAGFNNPPWPQSSSVFYDRVDFLSVALWDAVSDQEFPGEQEIDAGFERVFKGLDYAHQISQKPVVFAQVAYMSDRGAALPKGGEEYPTWQDPKANATRFDGKTQAMLYESIMRHVAERSYVEGLFPFGYWYVDAPATLDSSIRAKPAERILHAWMDRLP